MNYIELINNFWQIHDEYTFSTTEISLFFYLLKINNQCGWKPTFRRNNTKVQADLGISYNTLKTARINLQDKNIINFTSKNGYSEVLYSITLSKFDEVVNEGTNEGTNEGSTRVLTSKDKLNKTKLNNKENNKENLVFPFLSTEFKNTWQDLMKSKKWSKKPFTALQLALNKLGKESEVDAIKMLENSIMGDYQGIFPLNAKEKIQLQEKNQKITTNQKLL